MKSKSKRSRRVIPGFGLSLGISVTILSLVVLIPLCSLVVFSAQLSPAKFWSVVTSARVLASYKVSFLTALAASLINGVMGLILAWVLVRYDFPGKRIMDGMIELPFALPTAVAGIALTHLTVDNGWVGSFFHSKGIEIAYTRMGITVALVFIGIPFVVRSVQPVLEKLDPQYEEAAGMMGASRATIFRRIILPEIASPLVAGFTMAFEDIEGGAHGYFHLLDNRIAIQNGMSQLQTIKTAIHEIAHAKLHAIDPDDPEQANRPDSCTREVQAESVAYAVCQHYGLDTSEYSFGYVAGWSSGRELAELKASLEIIRSAAHELISALDEHLAELRQQREADLSAAQEAAFALDNGNTLFIQTCDSGYDYTLYGPDNKALDGGQLDAPGLTLPDAGQEALNLLGQTATVSEVLSGDKLAAFQDAAEKANKLPEPAKIPDPAAEPTVTILWSESDKLQDGEIMPLSVANRVFEELDTAQHTDREKDGYTGGWYDKTAFRIDFTLNGQPDNYEGQQDFGDGEGSLIQHIQNYHEYYAKDENWKKFVLHNKGPEAWEQDKAEREMVLTEFIPYLKQHCNLSAMEQTATTALREGQNISPEQIVYYNAVVAYVQDCRPLLNQGQYSLPEPPKLADCDQTLQDYKVQVQAEIAQEAAAAGMTVEEYAAAGFEAPQQDSFSIYQLRNEDSTRDYRFEPYNHLQAAGRTVDKANYAEVYSAPLAAGTTLEDIYRTFNVDHPADFKGHSLSVSDVVVLHQNGQDTAHYCDSVGFQQVPEFLQENPLRTAELSTEQNENMIDGVLNNAPSLGELEAKAKAGEQISLTDLAAAVKAEEKAPKVKKSRTAKPKKPSIRAQLDAAKKEQSQQTPPREKTKELEV